jgi:hypothetical protein
MRTGLLVLSKIYRVVEMAVFEDMAADTVRAVTAALVAATQIVVSAVATNPTVSSDMYIVTTVVYSSACELYTGSGGIRRHGRRHCARSHRRTIVLIVVSAMTTNLTVSTRLSSDMDIYIYSSAGALYTQSGGIQRHGRRHCARSGCNTDCGELAPSIDILYTTLQSTKY